MALTLAGRRLTAQHRAEQLRIRATLIREFQTLWDGIYDPVRPQTFDDFLLAATALIDLRRSQSSGLAAAYYTQFRADEGFGGIFDPTIAPGVSAERVSISLRATALDAELRARRAGMTLPAAKRAGFVRGSGAAARLALNGGRETVVETVVIDVETTGWQRVTSGSPCFFCAMIASRGAVFKESTAGFRAHDHCSCVPEPAYPGSEEPALNQRFRTLWNETTPGLSGRDAVSAFRAAIEGRAA